MFRCHHTLTRTQYLSSVRLSVRALARIGSFTMSNASKHSIRGKKIKLTALRNNNNTINSQ